LAIKHYLNYLLLASLTLPAWSEPILDKIKQLNDKGDSKAIIIEAESYLKEHPKDGDIQFFLAKAYASEGQDDKALEELKLLLAEYPKYNDATLLFADLNLKKEAYLDALKAIQDALVLSPTNDLLIEKEKQIKSLQETKAKIEKESELKEVTETPKLEFMDLYEKGKHQLAISNAKDYLKAHPKDVDAAFMLGQIYVKEKNYQDARELLLPYIHEYPNYTDLRLLGIQVDIQLKKYAEAKDLVIKGLKLEPKNKPLKKKKADIAYLMKPKAPHASSARIEPRQQVAKEEPVRFKNEIGVLQQNYYITDIHQVWDFTSVFYGHQTKLGKLFGRVNYANRLHRDAPQFEMEFFPKLNKYIYLDLAGALANQPILFPRYNYSGEAFFVLPKLFNVSGGGQFNRIDSIHEYARFTTSIAKDWKEHTLMFRPYFYNPGKGPRSILYTLNYRYMFLEPYGHWGLILGTGSTPDLADLQTVNFLKLQNKIISPYLNFAMLNDQLNVNISMLYQHQTFPSQRIRDWWGGTLGLAWRY
jgi:tetratricopeptide (TPR) repeat protein